ncbi:MAG: creatininase family protein [Thermoanaerobacteraceae bacterium]|uniref:creatininase family protein n=1 Tax=Thermanaeromonas sp. C210 TaxID=2731925 RepID=UPI00155BEFD5|nr:creatininase family protein [Thermanaeromonas sp. C210]MBE3582390.1 creatininase family protein [Thermoanaerobacteraceae bacterium]GFN21904.1 creatininase [Thermanaeromonas sp. C210]
MAKRYNLLECSFVEAQEWFKETDVVLVPVGSCEKHGAHVPLGTDSFTTISVTERAARLANVPYTPLLPFGYSPHHMGEVGEGCGTITLAAETFRRVLYDIARSLIYHGANKVVYVSHHGSNTKPIDELLRKIRYQTGAFVAWYKTPTERECEVVKGILEGPPEETPGWHAGEMETAQVMAYDESLVDMSRAVRDTAHAPRWMGPEFSKIDGTATVKFRGSENIIVPMEHHEYSDHATIGNPFRGTKEKGLKLFEKEAEHLAAFINEVKKFPFQVKNRDFPERA